MGDHFGNTATSYLEKVGYWVTLYSNDVQVHTYIVGKFLGNKDVPLSFVTVFITTVKLVTTYRI